ncbi:hypothetical protein A2U01_0099747, partial [Trifolium medium]|nr:hypothetical protein [Trifolium medium]
DNPTSFNDLDPMALFKDNPPAFQSATFRPATFQPPAYQSTTFQPYAQESGCTLLVHTL